MATEKPKPRNDTDGEVVYRRGATDQRPTGRPAEPRIDPTLMPLLVGCALLLLFVLVLGNLSVRRVEDTSREVLELEQQYAARATLLLRLRIALTRLDNEARNRAAAQARHELRPPFDLRLSTARDELSRLITLLDHAPLSEKPKWRDFRDHLQSYLETTRDSTEYSLHGFESFQRVDSELDDIVDEVQVDQEQIFQRSDAMQKAAARSIRLWSAIAILAGLLVTAGTIWESQRRFRQTRRSMEEARREREFSNQMLEGMVSAIAAIDRQDRIRSANATFFRLFPNMSIGASIHNQPGSPEAVRVLEAATASRVTRSIYRGRWNLNHDDDAGTYDVYSSPLEIDGELGQLLTLVDVTQAAADEATLRRTEALTAVGEAAAQLAHEIKNPLGSIRLGVSMLRDNSPNEEALKTISLVERGISHLNKLVVDVTQFSRHRQLERSEVDLHELIDSSLELVADRIQDKQPLIEKNYAAETILGNWDPDQLREVFVNLLANAIDAGAKNAKVEISTKLLAPPIPSGDSLITIKEPGSAGSQRARIVVTDHGSGIGEKALARVFEPFFTTKKRGTGLGLAVVRRIIDAHRGTISVTSEQGKGTSFRLELPLGPGDTGP
jgi:signal transduction histidine kinase